MLEPENQKGEHAGPENSESPVRPGMILSGRYRIEKELGRGGIGVVFLARDQQLLSRPVVVKVLLEKSYQDGWIKRKFLQEMEALVRIDHPGIVKVYDAGEMTDGKPYLVMQYIEGIPLRQMMGQPLSLVRVGRLVVQISQALGAAHDKGILHRDLKPENIMIQTSPAGEEEIKLIDFGLAKIHDSKIGDSSVVPGVAGSFGYMAPEQLLSRPAGIASDIYALAVIIYELITGRRPFQPESVFELYEMQRRETYLSFGELSLSVPTVAEGILRKALAFDPKDRPSTAREFGNHLSRALASSADTEIHRGFPVPETHPLPSPTIVTPIPSAMLPFFLAGIDIGLVSLFLKFYFYRFLSWTSFLSQPAAIVSLVVVAGLFFFGLKKAATARQSIRMGAVVLGLMIAAFCLWGLVRIPPVIRISTVAGSLNADPEHFTINYSDPKGYKYHLVNTYHCLISLDPGGHNQLNHYSLAITLSPDVEFAEVYLDRDFHLDAPQLLQPSNTNDVLLITKKDDAIRNPRSIEFSYKYRTVPRKNRVTVSLETDGQEFIYEADLKQ